MKIRKNSLIAHFSNQYVMKYGIPPIVSISLLIKMRHFRCSARYKRVFSPALFAATFNPLKTYLCALETIYAKHSQFLYHSSY